MATTIIDPNADVTGEMNWSSTGAAHYTEIDEGATPNETDYVSGTGGQTDQFDFPTPNLEGGTATNVQIKAHAGGFPSQPKTWGVRISVDGGSNWETQQTEELGRGSYSDVTYDFTISETDLSGLRVEIESIGVTGTIRCATMRAEITYEPAGTNTQINIGDAWKEISAMKINIGDDWKDIAGLQINIGDAWKVIF